MIPAADMTTADGSRRQTMTMNAAGPVGARRPAAAAMADQRLDHRVDPKARPVPVRKTRMTTIPASPSVCYPRNGLALRSTMTALLSIRIAARRPGRPRETHRLAGDPLASTVDHVGDCRTSDRTALSHENGAVGNSSARWSSSAAKASYRSGCRQM
jgi:hypothetical protein